MATNTKAKPQAKPSQQKVDEQFGEIVKNNPDVNSVTPANLANSEHHDSQEDARNHRVEELCKEAEHHIMGAAEAFGEDESVIKEAKDLVPDIQGRIRRIAQTAKTEDQLDREADEAIKAAERYIVNKGRAAQKKKKKEEEKKAEEEKEKKKGKPHQTEEEKQAEKAKQRLEGLKGDVANASEEEKQKIAEGIATPTERTTAIRAETEASIAAAGLHDAPTVDPQTAAQLDKLRGEVQNATPEQREAMAKGQPLRSEAEIAKTTRAHVQQEELKRGIVPEEIHAEIVRAIEHEQKKAQQSQTRTTQSALTPEQRAAAAKRISRGGRTARAVEGVAAGAPAAVAASKQAPAPQASISPSQTTPPAATPKSPPAPSGNSKKMMGSGPSKTRPRINVGPAPRRRMVPLIANESEIVEVREEVNDRGKAIIGREREDPGTFLDSDKTYVDSVQYPKVQRGGLGVPNSPPPEIHRGGLGQGLARTAAKHHARRMAEHAVERRAAWALMRTPAFWIVIFWIFVIWIIIMALLAIFSEREKKKQEQACTPTETMTQQIIGPADGTVGPELTYQIKIADTVPNQEVTTVVTIPPGQAFVRSDWTKFTVAGNVYTFKATENLPPNSLSPPNYTFSITLTARTPNSNEVLKAVTTPGRAGGAGGTVIVLDPGHGQESNVIDPATGLIDRESGNTPEREEVFEVAQKIKTQLEQKGYRVVLTKGSPTEGMTHRRRAEVANGAGAAIAVSIHNDHGQPFSWAEIYTQKVGLYRAANGKRVDFTDANLAAKSLEYANKIAAARAAAEGRPVPLRDANFDARPGYSSGNIPLVMLFGTVPWVYNEIGAAPVGVRVPPDQIDKYAQGIANGIEQAVPIGAGAPGGGGGAGCGPGGTGGGTLPTEVRDIPPTTDNCGGKYRLTSPFNNFGDPLCDYNEDLMNQAYQKYDAADAYKWDAVDDCESSNNPNAFNPNSTSGEGAYGSTQMNPRGRGNGQFDAGNVIWDQQAYNSVQYHEQVLNGRWNYWACAIN